MAKQTSGVLAAFCAAARAGLTLALAAVAAAAAPASPQQTFAGSTDVVEVEVPVQVVRDGQPVRGLKAEDFEVYDGRTRQTLTGFHAVDLAAPAAQRAAAVPLAGRRQFLLLFDLAFSDPKSVVKAREAARELVVKGLRPGDLVGVATYSAARGPQMILGLTSDRRQVDSALGSLGAVHPERTDDPLRLVMGRGNGSLRLGSGGDSRQIAGPSQEADAAHTDALFTDLGTEQATLNRDTNRAAQKASITTLTRAYSGLARTLAAIPGRKQVVYFSEGFDSTLITGIVPSFTDRPEDSPIYGQLPPAGVGSSDPHLENSDETFGNTQAINALEKMLEELRRADCVIQAVDLGGLRAGGEQQVTRTAGKDSLFAMAHGTGGELFEGSNDLSSAMSGLLQRTSLTYVLAFQPDKVKPDGAYHKLRVELKNAPRGTRVAFRPGWYAPRPYRQLNPMEKLFEASSKLMGGAESGSIPSAVLAAPFRAGDQAYVPVLIEVDGPALLADKPQGVLPVEVYVYALGADGAIQDFLFQALGLDLAKAETALRQSGLKFFGHLDLPAGEYSVRTLIRNGATGAYSLRASPLTVPAFATAGPVLLPRGAAGSAGGLSVHGAQAAVRPRHAAGARRRPGDRRGAPGLQPGGRRPQGRSPGDDARRQRDGDGGRRSPAGAGPGKGERWGTGPADGELQAAQAAAGRVPAAGHPHRRRCGGGPQQRSLRGGRRALIGGTLPGTSSVSLFVFLSWEIHSARAERTLHEKG
jgi:VWFA-related protein